MQSTRPRACEVNNVGPMNARITFQKAHTRPWQDRHSLSHWPSFSCLGCLSTCTWLASFFSIAFVSNLDLFLLMCNIKNELESIWLEEKIKYQYFFQSITLVKRENCYIRQKIWGRPPQCHIVSCMCDQ